MTRSCVKGSKTSKIAGQGPGPGLRTWTPLPRELSQRPRPSLSSSWPHAGKNTCPPSLQTISSGATPPPNNLNSTESCETCPGSWNNNSGLVGSGWHKHCRIDEIRRKVFLWAPPAPKMMVLLVHPRPLATGRAGTRFVSNTVEEWRDLGWRSASEPLI